MGASMIAALLKWTGLSQWAMELTAIGLVASSVAGFAVYEHHKIFEEGVTQETAKIVAQSAKDAAILTAQATTAEHSHDQELADLRTYRSTHVVDSVSLCVDPPDSVQTSGADSSGALSSGPSAATGQLQQVPAGNNPVRENGSRDIGPMLDALAGAADAVTAQARELQEIAK